MSADRGERAPAAAAVTVRVLFFGAARDAVAEARPEAQQSAGEVQIELRAPATGASARAEIVARYPALARFGRSLLFAVNCEYATPERPIDDGDELAFFPPVSGGGDEAAADDDDYPHDFFEITDEPIDVGRVARRVVLPACGATVTLDGYARATTANRPRTLYLIYEAYPPMALAEMRRLGRETHRRFPGVAYVGVVHRVGRTEIGETSVVVAVGAPHRRAAFEACEWVIKELKRTVPIWKKEFYEGGEIWVEGESGDGR